MKEKVNYSVGIDIGPSSVGWAVIDENFKLLKKGNKNLWGVRLFDTAETAKSRRMSRSSRRRYNRRRMRIRLLQEIMNDMIMEVDDTFFIRLKNTSFLNQEDKSIYLKDSYRDNYNLFIDAEYNDKNYYLQYPTIYHLRNHLVNSKVKEDPLLIYLALHHMIKYRGNFLYENQKFSLKSDNIFDKFNDLFHEFCDFNQINIILDSHQQSNLLNILKSIKTKSDRVEECLQNIKFDKEEKNTIKQFFSALVGLKFDVTKLFTNELLQYDEKNISLNFSSENYEEELSKYEKDLVEYMDCINTMNEVYSWIELQEILNESNSISEAMIKRYDEHKADLKLLKEIIRQYIPQSYNEVFKIKDKKKNNYYQYIHNSLNTKQKDFYEYILKILKKCPLDNENVQYCINKINNETFLLKQNDYRNANIPYQLQLDELQKIIKNQSIYYPDLKNNSDYIEKLLTYRIPYYIGPLNEESWLVIKEGYKNEEIRPWNLEDIVDVDQTAENFITRMTNHCTYLPDEPVMPKNSLTANMYEVLSELNKIRVNGKLLSVDIKNKIIQDLFMKHKTVNDKRLRNWIKREQLYLNNEDLEITGYQKEKSFSSSLTAWMDFREIFDDIYENYELIEKIIKDMTIFEDKRILKRRLKNIYNLSSNQIQKILTKKYTGWSRLSKKLIDGLYADNYISSQCTILDVMKETNKTLMEIINDERLGFKQLIENEIYQYNDGKFNYKEVKQLAGSPAIKRGIWQALKVIDEISDYMKHRPSHIYIEFARGESKKKRTVSQIKRLKDIYKKDIFNSLTLHSYDDKSVYENLKKEDESNKINNERLYLYYTQMGKCMYSQQPLDISKLHLYEVDHIVPQSLIPDDGLDNKVLVIKNENQRKSDDSLSSQIINNNYDFWKYLLDTKLISQKKFFNLIRTQYDERTTEKFINRQLVETRQIIKNVSQLILEHYTTTKVMTIRAGLSHQFRKKYNIYKNRDVNDFHHAHDAYIACIIGNFIQKCYPKLEAKYIYGEYQKFIKNKNKKRFNNGFILNSMDNNHFDAETGELKWDASKIFDLLKCFQYKDYFITKKLEDNDSSLFNVTIVPGNNNSETKKTVATIPVNKSRGNVEKYGGYSGLQYEILAIEGRKKKKIIRKLFGIPLVYKSYSISQKIKYIEEQEKLEGVHIIKTIKKNQLIEYKGGMFYITSAQELVNAQQLVLNSKLMEVLYNINQAIDLNDYSELKEKEENILELFNSWLEKLNKFYPLYNNIYDKIISKKEKFAQLSIEEQCKTINELLAITQAKATNGNIKFDNFHIGERLGRIRKRTILLDEIQFIEPSVTGIYSKKIKL